MHIVRKLNQCRWNYGNIFFKENEKLKLHQGISDFENIPRKDIVWIDLIQPSYDERIAIETSL